MEPPKTPNNKLFDDVKPSLLRKLYEYRAGLNPILNSEQNEITIRTKYNRRRHNIQDRLRAPLNYRFVSDDSGRTYAYQQFVCQADDPDNPYEDGVDVPHIGRCRSDCEVVLRTLKAEGFPCGVDSDGHDKINGTSIVEVRIPKGQLKD